MIQQIWRSNLPSFKTSRSKRPVHGVVATPSVTHHNNCVFFLPSPLKKIYSIQQDLKLFASNAQPPISHFGTKQPHHSFLLFVCLFASFAYLFGLLCPRIINKKHNFFLIESCYSCTILKFYDRSLKNSGKYHDNFSSYPVSNVYGWK